MTSTHKIVPLLQREWLQHRFGWALLVGIPLALALLAVGFGRVHFGDAEQADIGPAMPAVLALSAIGITGALLFTILSLTSGIIVAGLARRDHADRSVEFWMSVPVSHSQSLGVPMLVHLILVPAVALVVGLLGGYVVSLVLVARMQGIDAWLALPWLDIAGASLALAARVLVGLPLATLWLAPLILLVVLMTAWFRRWGWVMLAVGLGVGGLVLKQLFGQPVVFELVASLLQHSGQALIGFGRPDGTVVAGPGALLDALKLAPSWALSDLGRALADLGSPLLVGGLLFSAACFALLVEWRRRGASASA